MRGPPRVAGGDLQDPPTPLPQGCALWTLSLSSGWRVALTGSLTVPRGDGTVTPQDVSPVTVTPRVCPLGPVLAFVSLTWLLGTAAFRGVPLGL